MESSRPPLRPIPGSPWEAGILPGAGCITEQINLDPESGLATAATFYQARFHFPHAVIPNQDVYPTFARPRGPTGILKMVPHTVNTTWFPAWIINGYTVYCLPAEAVSGATCDDSGQPGTPAAPGIAIPGDGETPVPGGIVGPSPRPVTGPSILGRILLNASATELRALKHALDAIGGGG